MITNDEFLKSIFGESYIYAYVTSFMQDPGNIPSGESGRCWAGGAYKDTLLTPNSNQFYTVSLFSPDETGRSRRRKANFSACYVIGLDDVKEKLPIEQVKRLPLPSIVLKSSLYSEQWLYLLETPCTDINRIDNLHDGLIKNGLAPDSKDPGQKSVTRYLRLPESINTKNKRVSENNGIAPRCEVTEWHPEHRYTLEQLAEPFGVDLDALRADKRINGAAAVSDHPLINIPEVINIKEVRSDGRFDITCPWVGSHTSQDDSGSAIFTNEDGSIGFKCHHGNCQEKTGGDLLRVIESRSPGFNDRLKQWQVMREFTAVTSLQDPHPVKTILTTDSPSNMLRSLCANGSSHEMKKQMLNDRYIMQDLIIEGQFSVIYAAPSSGKTLLSLWLLTEAIKADEICGSDIYYINADDNYKGAVEKLELAEKHGFNMLIPNVNKFKVDALPSMMTALAEQDQAKGKVMLIDTVKAVTDLMDKKLSSQFGKTARSFVSSGGSIIALAHVNKNKGLDGKSIHAGTSDLKDDSDCVYVVELLNESKGFNGLTRTVQFENKKARGNVAQTKAFQYTRGGSYQELFDSVKVVSKDVVDSTLAVAESAEQESNDADVIEHVRTAIVNSATSKYEIEKFVMGSYRDSRRTIKRVLEEYEGRLWNVEKGLHNKSVYKLNEVPIAPVSFL